MLNCKQTSQLVSQSLDRNLTLRERLAVRLHLFICKYCRRFQRQLLAMRKSFKRMSEAIENDSSIQLPPETKARISATIESTHQ
ncbi:MAG: zf-HC2 domain-containing protein [Methylophilus sp.]|nr:zf-HC2 domain-containing protein [Methylophilus sp.]